MHDSKHVAIIIGVIGIAYFLEWVDMYALNTAFAQIAISFNTSAIHIKEALTVYLFNMGFFIPLSGWLAEKYGISRLYRLGILIFLIGSIGCASALNVTSLIIFRGIQGIGGAFLTPIGRLIMIKLFGQNRIAEAMAKITVVSSLGMVVGPLLGGALTTWQTWRWVFIINIPFGIIGFILILKYLPEFKKVKVAKFDVIGFIFIGLALALALCLLDVIPNQTMSISMKVIIAVIALGLFIGYYLHSRRTDHPLFPINLFSKRFSTALGASLIVRFAISAPPFLVPLLLQTSYHYNAFQAGLFLLATAVAIPIGKRCLMLMSMVLSEKIRLMTITILNALCLFLLSVAVIDLSISFFVALMFLFGLLMSMQQTAMNVRIYQSAGQIYYGAAVSCNSAIIQLGASFAIAISAMCIVFYSGNSLNLSFTNPTIFASTFATLSLFPLMALIFLI